MTITAEQHAAIATGYDFALRTAQIDQSTLELRGRIVSIRINGRPYKAAVRNALTPGSMREAIADCLGEHCATQAAFCVSMPCMCGSTLPPIMNPERSDCYPSCSVCGCV